MTTQADKAHRLRELHHGDRPLVLVNVWDVATARVAQLAGFPALATTSAGIAFAHGYPDGERIDRETMLEMVARIARKIDLPISADLEGAYGPTVRDAVETACAAVRAGAVGFNIEDSSHESPGTLVNADLQSARISGMRKAGDLLGVPLVINARTDGFMRDTSDEATVKTDAIARAHAYLAAGADCIFVPGVSDAETIAELVAAIPAPVNILAGPASPPLAELTRLGVRRVSLGSAPYGYALAAYRNAAREILENGTFAFTRERILHADTNAMLE